MNITLFLTYFFYVAASICGIGLLDKLFQLVVVKSSRHTPAAIKTIDAPSPPSFKTIAHNMVLGPGKHFHHKANLVWTIGYTFYHIAIFTLFTSYAISTVILLRKITLGIPIPDFQQPASIATNLSISNILAYIFGNAEPFPSHFLFGKFAPFFHLTAWIDLPFALIGNGCLLYTVLRKRIGAIRFDIDEAMQNTRIKGMFSGQHLMVRIIILSIILSEFIGRLGWIPTIAFYHSILALSLIAILPFTYLVHIPLAPLVLWLGFHRQRHNAIA